MEWPASQGTEQSCYTSMPASSCWPSENYSYGYPTQPVAHVWSGPAVDFHLPAAMPQNLHYHSEFPGVDPNYSEYRDCRVDYMPELTGTQGQMGSNVDYLVETQPSQYLLLTGVPDTAYHGHTAWVSERNMNHGIMNYNQIAGQTVFPNPSVHQAAQQPCPTPTATRISTVQDSKSSRPCTCSKSKCLQLYCDCFASGNMCVNCKCTNCFNNAEHVADRYKAMKLCLDRNPGAFMLKASTVRSGEVRGQHHKGCKCKRSNCLKNYCECYEAKVMCSLSCKCVDCGNCDHSIVTQKDTNEVNQSLSVITAEVVEATCECLLLQAEEAERTCVNTAKAESMILQEFGTCVAQIVKSMFKTSKR